MRFEVGNVKSSQLEALAKRVSDSVLLFAKDLGHDENVVEEKYFALVESRSLSPTSIGHLVESAVADESPVW
jgi:hypothetical protein